MLSSRKKRQSTHSIEIGNFEYSFYFSSTKSNWNDAQAECNGKGGMNLASITSQELQDFVISQIVSSNAGAEPIFIGGNDINNEGNFEWMGGEPWDYSQPLRQTANDEAHDCIGYAANDDTGEDVLIY